MSDDSSSTLITAETVQFHTFNREHSEELSSVAGDSNFALEEKQHCLLGQVTANHKRRARWKKNTQKPESQHAQQTLPGNPNTTLHAAMIRPNDSESLKLSTVLSPTSSFKICKNSLTNEADATPSTSKQTKEEAPQDTCNYQPEVKQSNNFLLCFPSNSFIFHSFLIACISES
ncbi:hypothetical protein ACTXT7_008349 [Hymenolepis weldensis]